MKIISGEPMSYWKAVPIALAIFLLLSITPVVVLGWLFGASFSLMVQGYLGWLCCALGLGVLMGIGKLLLWIFDACMEKLVGKEKWEQNKREANAKDEVW
jgi:membrane protein implicated in regulation of membrane protease activity